MALNLPPAPQGKHTLTVNFDGTTLETFTYRPAGEIKGVLLDFHGSERNGESTRDAAVKIADAYGLYVVAPVFDADDFSNSEYQRGGLVTSSGTLLPKDDWTVSLIDDIAEWAHAQVGNDPDDETIGFGHSAGGQFMSRIAAFGPDIFDKMIIANPSTHVRASLEENLPYGFDGLPSVEAEAYLKDYLADPVTIYAGSADNDPDSPDLSMSSAAMRQGDDRLERALFAYEEARELAASRGWEFNWELVIADGVGHSSRGMLDAPEFQRAFDGRTGVSSEPIPDTDPTPGYEVFEFDTVSEWHRTGIAGFNTGDRLDFSDIDANTTLSGHQQFEYLGRVGRYAFTSAGAEIRLRHHDGNTYVYLNTDSDRYYEARGKLEGIHHLTADDFVLASEAPEGEVFDFDTVADWNGAIIEDFAAGDVLDFSDIDANRTVSGHQEFEYLGKVGPDAFTSAGAEIRLRHYDGDTYVYLNTDDDRYYEGKGMIEGIHHLTADDFVL